MRGIADGDNDSLRAGHLAPVVALRMPPLSSVPSAVVVDAHQLTVPVDGLRTVIGLAEWGVFIVYILTDVPDTECPSCEVVPEDEVETSAEGLLVWICA